MSYDYSPLTMTVSADDIATYKGAAGLQAGQTAKIGAATKNIKILALVSGVVIIVFALSGIVFSLLRSGDLIGTVNSVPALVWFIPVFITMLYSLKVRRKILQNEVRLYHFAKQNNLEYTQALSDPRLSGMVFDKGRSRVAFSQLARTGDSAFQIANYTYTTGSGKSRQKYTLGYVAIELPRKLPHMVLDSKRNNVKLFGLNLSNLPVNFNKSQHLSLEGDFDSHFTLYAPLEYERDALYVFTPDLMALFIDQSGAFDAEIVDDTLFIYSDRAFEMTDTQTLSRLFSIIETVGKKAVSQTTNYADERTGDRSSNAVAAPGQRLKKQLPVVLIVIVGVFILLQILSTIFPMLVMFFSGGR